MSCDLLHSKYSFRTVWPAGNTFLLAKIGRNMKEQELLLKELAGMMERQDMLSKLTESHILEGYGYSETQCIDAIGRIELPNVTKISEQMGMTRGAISKMTKKLLAKDVIEKFTLDTNKKEIYFRLTSEGQLLFEEHEKRHQLWEKRDTEFLNRYPKGEVDVMLHFMKDFNVYLQEKIEELSAD